MALDSKHILIDELRNLQHGKDYVYAAIKKDLFKTYCPFTDDTRYFGSYEKPYRDTSYSISPKVYKLKKLLYLGLFEAKETFDKVFVFSDSYENDHDLRFSGYVLLWRYGYRGLYDWQNLQKYQ